MHRSEPAAGRQTPIIELEIAIGQRRIEGTIKERHEAPRAHRRARRKGLLAALLTQQRPNLFTQHVANIQ